MSRSRQAAAALVVARSANMLARALILTVVVGLSGCVFPSPTPTSTAPSASDVLKGSIAGAEQESAIAAVTNGSTDLLPKVALKVIGTHVMVTCKDGQNNVEVRDGYRLKCSAVSHLVVAWPGSFQNGHDPLKLAVQGRCGFPENPPRGLPPQYAPLFESEGDFKCGDGRVVQVTWATTEKLVPTDWNLQFEGQRYTETIRVLQPLTGTQIVDSLSAFQWFAIVDTTKTFYEDKP